MTTDQNSIPTIRCPHCAEEILAAAVVCKHCGRRVRGCVWPWWVGGGLAFLLLLIILSPDPPAVPVVMAVRDLDKVTFINETDEDLSDCEVTIDGGYEATLDRIEPRKRGEIPAYRFNGGSRRDEFHMRTLRRLEMTCLDSAGRRTAIGIK